MAYTRAGFIKLLESGELATSGVQRLLDAEGRPITVLPEQAGSLTIAEDGTVMSADGPVGRLAISGFASETQVDPRGDGLMNGVNGRFFAAAEVKLKAGGVEASNVQPIVETTKMVEILRAYQTSVGISDSMNSMRQRAIERLGKVA